MNTISTSSDLTLTEQIRTIGFSLGFQAVRFVAPHTDQHQADFEKWLSQGYQGDMDWLSKNLDLRFDPAKLHPGTKTIISVRMDYWPEGVDGETLLSQPNKAYISRYALGRDYHKVLRKRLNQFATAITELTGDIGARPFVDSAPVLERQLAEQAGMGWIGKNTLLLAPGAGSWFFLGELCTNLELPPDPPQTAGHCGSCQQCMVDCPTNAFVAEGVLDARKCISYLTIESDSAIPTELRSAMGNRIYGCDDCQLVCPHNRKAPVSQEADFSPRSNLDNIELKTLFEWDESTFLKNTEGSPIRRIGYEKWQRNLAVALGNGPADEDVIEMLTNALGKVSAMVDEHLHWAIAKLRQHAE